MGDKVTSPRKTTVPPRLQETPGSSSPAGTGSPGEGVSAITEALASIQQQANTPAISSPVMNERTRLFSNRRGTPSSFGSPSPNEKSSLRPQELAEKKTERVVEKVGALARRSLFGKLGTGTKGADSLPKKLPDGSEIPNPDVDDPGDDDWTLTRSAGQNERLGAPSQLSEFPLRGAKTKGASGGFEEASRRVRWMSDGTESAPPSYCSEEGSEASFGSESSDEGIIKWWWNSRPRTVLWHLPVQLFASVFLAAAMGTAGSVLGAFVFGEDDLVHYHPTLGRMTFGFLFSVTGSFLGAYFPPKFCHSQTTASWRMMLAASYPSGMFALAMAHEGQSWWSGALLLPCMVNVVVYWATLRDKNAPDPDDPDDSDPDTNLRPWKRVQRERDAHLQLVAEQKRGALGMR